MPRLIPEKPDPTPCRRCHEPAEPTFVEAPVHFPVAGWWHRGDECERCRSTALADATARSISSAQDRAGIPDRYRGFRFERYRMQEAEGSFDEFRGGLERGELGVTRWNLDAVQALRVWPQECGTMVISGPVGSGKSALAYAALNTAISRDPEASVAALSEARLLELPRDPVAVRRLASTRYLLIDDLGAKERLSKVDLDRIELVVMIRYDHQLPTIVTTNLPLASNDPKVRCLARLYGERVGSRLLEMVGGPLRRFGGYLELRGFDWRSGEAHPGVDADGLPNGQRERSVPALPPRRDHRRDAAGDRDDP